MVAAALAVVVSGLAIFVAPGAVVLAAARINLPRTERFAFEVAASLVLLAAAFAACLALETSLDAAPVLLALLTAGTVIVARAVTHNDLLATSARSTTPAVSRLVIVLLTVVAAILAVSFAPVGSIDRWWYLAYVRSWLEAPVLTLAEPFLGTDEPFARFGIHPWLFGLAIWSRLSGVDPVLVYERAAPALVVLASVSAARAFAVALFGDGRRARLCVIATLLLWSGSVVPVLARAGEDKVLAASALLPVCIAAFLLAVRAPTYGKWMLLAFATVATAAVHALAYAFALLVLLPMTAIIAWRRPLLRRASAIAAVILVAVAIAPALTGLSVHGRLDAIGAELATPDHPVVRVHQARDRLIEFPSAGYIVSPRLLAHPIVLLAFTGILVLLRRRQSTDSSGEIHPEPRISGFARAYIVVAFVVPLAIAFVPPLPVLFGALIAPWMVYRVLWLLPLAPLAAIAAGRIGRNESAAMTILLLLGVPVLVVGARDRLTDVRERLAAPQTTEFRELVAAVHALPADALVVAAPELAERLPALTARHVVAALDRSTIVFAGSRDLGEARLRARAALLGGDTDADELAAAARIRPTHAIFDPRSNDQPRCSTTLHAGATAALCALDATAAAAVMAEPMQQVPEAPRRVLVEGECQPQPPGRRDPWAASVAVAHCEVAFPFELQGRDNLLLLIETSTGRAVDELRIRIDGSAVKSARAVVRVSGSSAVALLLPQVHAGLLEVRIASSFLPFVHPLRVAVATR